MAEMWPFGRMSEKFWHHRTAQSGKLLVPLFGLIRTLWRCENCSGCAYFSLCPTQSLDGTPGSREITDRSSHVRQERSFTCPRVLTILRILPQLEKNSFGTCLSCLKFTKWKVQSWFLERVLFCVLYKYVVLYMHIFIHALNLEKELYEKFLKGRGGSMSSNISLWTFSINKGIFVS